MGHTGTKQDVRAKARASRRSGPAADPEGLAASGAEFLTGLAGPARVTCYSSYGTEPDTSALIRLLHEMSYDVLLPRVNGDILEWALASGPSVVSDMGIIEPTGAAVGLLPVRALLIPALAVTPSGDRLGKGGGYYDRVIAGLPLNRPVLAAIVRDEDVLPDGAIPVEAHDGRVDAIVTPTRIVWCES